MGPSHPFAGCHAIADMLGMAGVGISLAGQPLHASTGIARDAEAQQYVLGEGPMIDAYLTRRPVEVPDTSEQPWLQLDLDGVGIGAVFTEPLVVGNAGLGAMSLYRRRPGALGAAQRELAHLVAERTAVEVGALVVSQHATDRHHPALQALNELRRAIGIVIAHLAVSVEEATSRLRAHVYQSGRSLDDVVADLNHDAIHLQADLSDEPR